MYRVYFFAIVLLCIIAVTASHLHAQPTRTVAVNLQPLAVIPAGNLVHILCGRVDANFDGVQDAGDAAASWVTVDATTYQTVRTLNFLWQEGIGFPSRPAFNANTNRLYLSQNGRIRAFDALTQAVVRDTVVRIDTLAQRAFSTSGSVSALSVDAASNRLYITLRGSATSAVVELDIATSRIVTTYPAHIFAQQTAPYQTANGRKGIAIMNEGNFNSMNATVFLSKSPTESTVLNVGGTANHLLKQGDSLFVTMNSSHEVHIVDLNTERIVRTIPTGTTGFDGPRESALQGTTLYVTTYAGDVRRFNIATGREFTPRLNPQGKPEAVAVVGSIVWVTNAYKSASYDYANTVAVFNPTTLAVNALNERPLAAELRVFPNPVTEQAQVTVRLEDRLNTASVRMTLVNALGVTVAELVSQQNTQQADETMLRAEFSPAALGLSSGQYFVRVQAGSRVQAIPVHIIR